MSVLFFDGVSKHGLIVRARDRPHFHMSIYCNFEKIEYNVTIQHDTRGHMANHLAYGYIDKVCKVQKSWWRVWQKKQESEWQI